MLVSLNSMTLLHNWSLYWIGIVQQCAEPIQEDVQEWEGSRCYAFGVISGLYWGYHGIVENETANRMGLGQHSAIQPPAPLTVDPAG